MRPTPIDYALMAQACYGRSASVPGWQRASFHHITDGPLAFTAASFMADGEMVIAFAGTDPKNITDIKSDVTIAIGRVPSHANAARKQFNHFVELREGRRVSVVGHSLGGAIAQIIAFNGPVADGLQPIDYTTFCAPFVGRPENNTTIFDPGQHFIVPEDYVHRTLLKDHRKLIKLIGSTKISFPQCHYMDEVISRIRKKAL